MKYKIVKALCFFLIVVSLVSSYMNIPDSFILYKDTQWSSGSLSDILTNDASLEVSRGIVVAKKEGSYQAALSLFGVPYKEVTLEVIDNEEVFVGGQAIGIRLFSDGLLVIATGRVNKESDSPAQRAGIREGDVITKINSEKILSLEEFTKKVENTDKITLEIKRGEEKFEVKVTPERSEEDGVKRIGLWVRDSTAGVGTLTYVSAADLSYGALGHAVSDTDTGKRFEVLSGTIERCKIGGITKGERGAPGELRGVFYQGAAVIGDIEQNKKEGIFGRFTGRSAVGEKVALGHKNEIEKGKAYIRTSLDGETVESYEIEILKVSKNTKNPTKGMVIKVTDERLLQKTGGIVQGMSGSPILQNGKLIGAVTHVLVNDPTKGYGIFIENMLSAARENG